MAKLAIRTLVVETYESVTQVQVCLQQKHMCLQSRSILFGSKDTKCRALYKEPRSHIRTIGHSGGIAPWAELPHRTIGRSFSQAHGPPPQPGPGIGLSPIITERHSKGRYARYPSELWSGQLLWPNRQYEHSSLRHTSLQNKYKFACSKDTCVYRAGQYYPDPRTRSVVHHTKNPGATS